MADISAYKQYSDEELVEMVQAGSHHCFEEIICRFSQRLSYFLSRKVSDFEDVEDLLQETFLKAYRNINRFNHRFKFSTWIYTVASRLAISYYRKKKVNEPIGEISADSLDPQENLIATDMQKKLWQKARSLRPDHFRVLWLRYIEEMSFKEIGKVMGKRQSYVRVILHRARSNLIQQINSPVPPILNKKTTPIEKSNLLYKEGVIR